jgi:hypothetical protein
VPNIALWDVPNIVLWVVPNIAYLLPFFKFKNELKVLD